MLQAVLAVLPVEAVMRAALNNDPAQAGAIHRQIDALAQGCGQSATSLSGDQLYPRIRAAYAVVATSEPALFANVLLRKAALPPSNS
jgi:L-fucose mutarotase